MANVCAVGLLGLIVSHKCGGVHQPRRNEPLLSSSRCYLASGLQSSMSCSPPGVDENVTKELIEDLGIAC